MTEIKISRRDFLKLILPPATLAALWLIGCRQPGNTGKGANTGEQPASTPTPDVPHNLGARESTNGELTVQLGAEQSARITGLPGHYPDGRLSFVKTGDTFNVFISAGPTTYLLRGHGLGDWVSMGPVIKPDQTISEKGYQGYRGFGTVIKGRTPDELIGFYHEEHWPDERTYFPYHAQVGLAISHNRGTTWKKIGPIITGQETGSYDSGRVFGAGQPSAMIINGEIYLHYVDWNSSQPDAIHVAKAPLFSIDDPFSWKKWNGHGFETSGIGGTSVAVLRPEGDEAYAALPAISFNSHLGKYLAVYETDVGFMMATSSNGIEWSRGLNVLPFDRPQWTNPKSKGDSWISYPTLLSDTQDSSLTTNEGFLFHSRGKWGESPHTMVKRMVQFT